MKGNDLLTIVNKVTPAENISTYFPLKGLPNIISGAW